MPKPMEIHLGDVVRLRKPHPCGGYEWRVVRIGADIGIKCLTCGRRVLMPRRKFEKSVKKFISRAGVSMWEKGSEGTKGPEGDTPDSSAPSDPSSGWHL